MGILNQHRIRYRASEERITAMTAQISAYGRLVPDPQTRTTGKGTNMATARLAVALPCNVAENGEATFWLGVIAFGKQADALAKHHKAVSPD